MKVIEEIINAVWTDFVTEYIKVHSSSLGWGWGGDGVRLGWGGERG
jgi:hypothetical protein